MKIKLNLDLRGKKKGDIIIIDTDDRDIPLDSYWFRRFKDAQQDNCVEIVKETTKKVTKKKGE